MQLIRKTKRRLSKTGNSYIYFGLFLCPYCKKEVEKGMSNGGLNKSCGCASSKLKAKTKTIHGESTKRIYHIWTSMKKRCSNKYHEKQYYFNRGIKVYKGWENNYIVLFGNFLERKNKKSLIGFFVHELCHLSDLKRFSVIGSFIRYNIFNDSMFLFKYNFLERRADILSIEKGYAKEIFANVKFVSERYPKWVVNFIHSRGYMSLDEIKSYAKEVGKW